MQRQMRRAGAEAARRRAAPHEDIVLLRGKLGPYWQSDFTKFEDLEQETRGKIDVAWRAWGSGTSATSLPRSNVTSSCGPTRAGDGVSYGLLMAKRKYT